MEKITESHYQMKDKFGYILLNNKQFNIERLDFYSESLHSISGKRLAMELQATAISNSEPTPKDTPKSSSSNNNITTTTPPESPSSPETLKFSILFESADVSYVELYPIGIGRGMIKQLPMKRMDPKNSKLGMHTVFSLDDLVEDSKKVIYYVGNDPTEQCKESHFLVLFETLWIGNDQISEFKENNDIHPKAKDPVSNQKIMTNFIVQG